MKIKLKNTVLTTLALLATHVSATSYARTFEVTITNLTKGVSFTPLLVSTHNKRLSLFELGQPASEEVGRIAEGGDISGLNDQLSASSMVRDTASSEGLLAPGQSVTLTVEGGKRFKKVSIISMLLPTNDTLVALRGANLPKERRSSVSYLLNAYDGGVETNDELCASIPGPHCGGIPFSPEDEGEGYIYPSPAIHGEGDLFAKEYQWQGPVAKVVIKRVH